MALSKKKYLFKKKRSRNAVERGKGGGGGAKAKKKKEKAQTEMGPQRWKRLRETTSHLPSPFLTKRKEKKRKKERKRERERERGVSSRFGFLGWRCRACHQ